MDNTIAVMREMRDVQGANGNWNYDPYMHGLYNVMEYMLAMAEKREPEFREAPSEWLADRPTSKLELAAEAAIESTESPNEVAAV